MQQVSNAHIYNVMYVVESLKTYSTTILVTISCSLHSLHCNCQIKACQSCHSRVHIPIVIPHHEIQQTILPIDQESVSLSNTFTHPLAYLDSLFLDMAVICCPSFSSDWFSLPSFIFVSIVITNFPEYVTSR